MLTVTAVALLFSFRTPSELFPDGTATAFTPDLLRTTAVETGSAGTTGPGGRTPAGLVLRTMPPATEPPATELPTTELPTMPPATEPPVEHPVAQVIAGQAVRTRFGLVQVEVTLAPEGITDVRALQLPFDRSYSARISRYVEPILREEALQAQSASIDLISGATYTSSGFAMSLQSALDQAA